MNPAEDAMSAAKRHLTEAAQAALAGNPDAPELAKKALEEVQRARNQLQEQGAP